MMLRRLLLSFVSLFSALRATGAWAQAWLVCWGPPGNQICAPASVPTLSPWVLVAVSALLALAAVWVLRRRSGIGALLIAGVLVLAATGSHQIKDAWATSWFYIQSAAGEEFNACIPQYYPLDVRNAHTSPVQIFVRPSDGASLNWPVGQGDTKCASGMTLAVNEACYLPCAPVHPDEN